MEAMKKGVGALLVLTMLALGIPDISYCGGKPLFAKAEEKTITEHEPKIMSAPEREIPKVAPEGGEPAGTRKYLWLGLGAAALIGLVAAVAGGSGGSSSGGDRENPPPDTEEGNISASW